MASEQVEVTDTANSLNHIQDANECSNETDTYDDDESLKQTHHQSDQQAACFTDDFYDIDTQSDLFKEIYSLFLGQISSNACAKLESLINQDCLKLNDLSASVLNQLKEINYNEIDSLLDELESELNAQQDLNLLDLLNEKLNKKLSMQQKQEQEQQQQQEGVKRPGPNEQKLKEILERTGYSHEVSSGQRKYGGPPPDWPLDAPGAPVGCECFVGKLPKDLFEDELIPVFEKVGRIWDLRLMIDPSNGFSKGYCFVTYCDRESTLEAAKNFNNYEIRPGKDIRVNISVANVRLFIRNIPKVKSRDELKQEFAKLVEGIHDVIISDSTQDNEKLKNRGYCFVEFIDHKTASMAKRKLSSPRFSRLFNRDIVVDWADQTEEPDEETMSKVKTLFVKNLSSEVTEEEVQKVFEQYGKLERVRKMRDYAFVQFEQREDAVKAMQEQQAKQLGKSLIEINLARPINDKKKQAQLKRNQISQNAFNYQQQQPQQQQQRRNFTNYNNSNRNMNFNNQKNRNIRSNGSSNNNKRKNDFNSSNSPLKKSRFITTNGSNNNNQNIDYNQQQFNQFDDTDGISNEWYQDNFNSNQWM